MNYKEAVNKVNELQNKIEQIKDSSWPNHIELKDDYDYASLYIHPDKEGAEIFIATCNGTHSFTVKFEKIELVINTLKQYL